MSRGKGRQKWRCSACNKVSFGSVGRAIQAIETVVAAYGDGSDHKIPQRVYPCQYGNGYHITSEVERV